MIRTGRLGGWSLVAGQRQESGIISGQPVMWYISHLISLELRRALYKPSCDPSSISSWSWKQKAKLLVTLGYRIHK